MPAYLFDSNALIYSADPAPVYDALRELLVLPFPSGAVSAISLVEVPGFSRLEEQDQLYFSAVFQNLEIIAVRDSIITEAIKLGYQCGLKAADAIIAASARSVMRTLVSADTHFLRVPDLTVLHPLNIT